MDKVKLLIVEDNKILQDLYYRILGKDYNIVGVLDNGKEVMDFINNKPLPDLILMDIYLSGTRTGIDIAQEIHQIYYIPIIFISSAKDVQVIRDAKKIRPYIFIPKIPDWGVLKHNIDLITEIYSLNKGKNFSNINYNLLKMMSPNSEITTSDDGIIYVKGKKLDQFWKI